MTEQVRLLEAAVGRINDMIIITDARKRDASFRPTIVYVNEAFDRITGYTRDQVIGRTPRILQGPKTQRSELDRIRKALETESPVRAEVINYTKCGREYWLELDIVPVTNEAGDVTHFVSIQRDTTDRRRTEEALRMSETRFRLIAEASGSAVWDWNIAEGRLWWSDGMFQQFDHQPDPEGKPPTVWRKNVHPEDIERVDEQIDRLLLGEIREVHNQYRFRRSDGTWAQVKSHAFLIHDDEA